MLDKRQNWEGKNFDKTKHFDFDWIKHSVHSLLLEFESGTLKQNHLETWYNIHIWSLIDKSFNELIGVDVARGESCSLASAKRKNKHRVIQGLVSTTRKALGRRGDLILRKGMYEYGASEVGKDYEGDNGTKLLRERGLKSPKMLKDMLVDLGNYIKWERNKLRQLELIRFSIPIPIPTDVGCFEEALKCMVLTWKAKAIVRKTIGVIEGINDDDDDYDVLENLQEAGVRKRKDCIIIPNCVRTPQKKRTVPQTSQVRKKKEKE
ncbi:hypothetical protein RhiirA1_471610 [Rhizophagus irregularis]|uniref:Uncharacterized protein n=1 Tax=Rhizophagus irregularis TaxID=588596 RepID=A0A2N0R3Y9_9GLOM|nr:hypothetical protein RhiirA1_471610 [Rhizophagus irregularis]